MRKRITEAISIKSFEISFKDRVQRFELNVPPLYGDKVFHLKLTYNDKLGTVDIREADVFNACPHCGGKSD